MVRHTSTTVLHVCVNSFAVVVSPKPSVVFPTCSFVACDDSEPESVVLVLGFFSDEQTNSFAYAIESFVDICGGHPGVSCD